jgi:hypothetical protein
LPGPYLIAAALLAGLTVWLAGGASGSATGVVLSAVVRAGECASSNFRGSGGAISDWSR